MASDSDDDSELERLQQAVETSPTPERWAELAQACARRHQWEDGLIAAWPAGLVGNAPHALRRCAAGNLPKGWMAAVADATEWLPEFFDSSDHVYACGPGVAVAAVQAISDGRVYGPKTLHLPVELCAALRPPLERALAVSGTKLAVGVAGAPARRGLTLWDLPPTGPSLALLRSLRAGGACDPVVLQLWALPVCASPQGAGLVTHMSKPSLSRLLSVEADSHGLDLGECRAHLLESQPLIPLDARDWSWTPAGFPRRLFRWDLNTDPPTQEEIVTPVPRDGPPHIDALLLWCDVQLASGSWRSRAPALTVAAAPPGRQHVSCAEPQFACALPRTALQSGDRVKVRVIVGESRIRLESWREDPRRPGERASAPPPLLPPCALQPWGPLMMNDAPRAAAFEAALLDALRAATPPPGEDVLVLDIGCGAGLLSLLAARAAKRAGVRARVIGVEREPALAALATRVLAANGAALAPSTLSAACARSSALRPGTPSLPRRADIAVAEVFGDDPLSEGAIRTLRHAASTLLADGGRMIPRALAVFAALAAVPDEILRRAALPSIVRALEPGRVCADLRHTRLSWVTESTRLWGCSFDAPASLPTHATGEAEVEVTASTPPNAIVVWWELDVGGGATLSSGVDSATHWRQLVIPLDERWRRPLAPGSRATLRWEVSAEEECVRVSAVSYFS